MKRCVTCRLDKNLDEFGNNKLSIDGKQKYCKECGKLKDKKHYSNSNSRKKDIKEKRKNVKERNRNFLLEHLKNNPCVDCGETNPLYLEFDHIKGNKKHNVSSMLVHCIETVVKEIDKCEVRCVKCHRKKTAIQFNWEWAKEFI